MGHKIDSQMLQIYNRCTDNSSDQGARVSENEALQLIRRAEEINNNHHSSSYSAEHRRGNKQLLRLMREHKHSFSADGQKMIQRYVRTGQLPSTNIGGSPVIINPGNGMQPTRPDLPNPPNYPGHPNLPSYPYLPSNPGHPNLPNLPSNPGRPNLPNLPSNPGRPNLPNVPSPPNRPTHPSDLVGAHDGNANATISDDISPVGGGRVGETGPRGKIILDFTAKKLTWGCHWFPMQETRPGGDPVNNLYADGGALHKLDMLTGGTARDYEYNKNRKALNAGAEFHWWGHCNNAAEAACILPEPKHGVVMTAKDGSEIKFKRGDIQGLLVKVTPCLIDRVDFRGERFNSPSRDNPNDPAPAMFMDVMKEWAKDGYPFVLDIDNKEQVWNFPYDQVLIQESDVSPEGFAGISGTGVKYYHIDMSGTGYDSKRRVYECYVKRDRNGAVLDSGWIKTPNTHNNPDFMWRPHPVGDVMDRSSWQVRGGAQMSNPEVDPQIVYEIYMKSLA